MTTGPGSPPRSATWRLADSQAGGQLAVAILALRAEGASWAAVSRALHSRWGVEVDPSTLYHWGRRLGVPASPH
ncbi:MAG: hypothetical protein ACRD0D_03710 [Acidimicrobiales bacterium]